jgi:predicted metal-dependent phosphoesterase TrpH
MSKEWLLCDFHIHTKFSDGEMDMEDVVDFYGERNFDVIAITDHALDRVSSKVPQCIIPTGWIANKKDFNKYQKRLNENTKRAWLKYNMLVIPGMEITNYILNQHILILGVKEYICPCVLTSKTLSLYKEQQDVFVIGAHPFYPTRFKLGSGTWKAMRKLRGLIDAWELGNDNDVFPHVLRAGVPYVANSDFHGHEKYGGIDSWKNLIYAEKDIDSIRNAILNKHVAVFKYKDRVFK